MPGGETRPRVLQSRRVGAASVRCVTRFRYRGLGQLRLLFTAWSLRYVCCKLAWVRVNSDRIGVKESILPGLYCTLSSSLFLKAVPSLWPGVCRVTPVPPLCPPPSPRPSCSSTKHLWRLQPSPAPAPASAKCQSPPGTLALKDCCHAARYADIADAVLRRNV